MLPRVNLTAQGSQSWWPGHAGLGNYFDAGQLKIFLAGGSRTWFLGQRFQGGFAECPNSLSLACRAPKRQISHWAEQRLELLARPSLKATAPKNYWPAPPHAEGGHYSGRARPHCKKNFFAPVQYGMGPPWGGSPWTSIIFGGSWPPALCFYWQPPPRAEISITLFFKDSHKN